MKPFDYELAAAGGAVITRDGRSVERLTYFPEVATGEYCFAGVVGTALRRWTRDGSSSTTPASDLFMKPTTVYLNFYTRDDGTMFTGAVYLSREVAQKNAECPNYNVTSTAVPVEL